MSERCAYLINPYICSVAFATDIEKIVFLTFLLIRRSLVNFMSQGMSFRKAVQPIGRGLLFSYPLIKVYQSLPNGMKDDGTRSFLLELEQLGKPKTRESRHSKINRQLL